MPLIARPIFKLKTETLIKQKYGQPTKANVTSKCTKKC